MKRPIALALSAQIAAEAPATVPTGEYKVGRGKPPKEYQFKKGQCGNPKGRPKGTRSLPQEVKHHLDGKITVRAGGQSKKMQRREALVHSLYERAVKGDNRASDILFKYNLMAEGALHASAKPALEVEVHDWQITEDWRLRREAEEAAS